MLLMTFGCCFDTLSLYIMAVMKYHYSIKKESDAVRDAVNGIGNFFKNFTENKSTSGYFIEGTAKEE